LKKNPAGFEMLDYENEGNEEDISISNKRV
jgi:hypothetical protein